MTPCENLTVYFYEELGPRERGEFEEHLKACSLCRRELAFLQLAQGALHAPAAPQAAVDKLFAKTTRRKPFFAWLKPALLSAGVLGAGVFIFMTGVDAVSPAYDRQEVLAYLSTNVDEEYQSFAQELEEFENEF